MPSSQASLQKTLQQFYQNPVAKVSLELFLSLGTIIFFALFAIRPTLLTMSDLLKEIQDKKDLAVQLDRKIAALSTVQAEYLRIQDKLGLLDQSLPNTPELVSALKVMEKMASDNQLAIESVSVNTLPEETTDTPAFGTVQRVDLPITISVTGNYPSIRQFIEDLQSYRRSFVVDTIIFTTSEDKGAVRLGANITVYIPYYSSNTPGQKNAAAEPKTTTAKPKASAATAEE